MKVFIGNGKVVKIKNFRRGYGFLKPCDREDRKSQVIKYLVGVLEESTPLIGICPYCGVYMDASTKHSYTCLYIKAEEIKILIEGGWF